MIYDIYDLQVASVHCNHIDTRVSEAKPWMLRKAKGAQARC